MIYRSADGHLNEIGWVRDDGIPAHVDITLQALAPLAEDLGHKIRDGHGKKEESRTVTRLRISGSWANLCCFMPPV